MRPRRQPAGFTLIELLIVVAVMGILAGLVLPSSTPSLHDQLRSAARIVAGDLAYGRSLAVTYNSRYRFTFDIAGNRYVLRHSGSNPTLDALPESPLRLPEDPPDQQIVELEELPHLGPTVRIIGVAVESNPSELAGDLEFGPLGATTRSQPTAIWLAAGTGPGTRYIPLHVNPVTGLTSVGTYTGDGPLWLQAK